MTEAMLSPYLRLINRTGVTRHPGGLKISDLMLQKIGIKRNFRILDMGCGAGHTSAHVAANYGCTVVGVDISDKALDHARALYGNEPYFERMSFLKADLSDVPFSDQYFDVVLCESVLLFVKDKARAFKEMARVTKPKGHLLLNELCLLDHTQALKKYWARPEMAAFLLHADELSALLDRDVWSIRVQDEQVFTLKEQFKADWAQFANKKGLLQLLELTHLALTDKETRDDLMSVLKFTLKMPPSFFKSLRVLALLAQKH